MLKEQQLLELLNNHADKIINKPSFYGCLTEQKLNIRLNNYFYNSSDVTVWVHPGMEWHGDATDNRNGITPTINWRGSEQLDPSMVVIYNEQELLTELMGHYHRTMQFFNHVKIDEHNDFNKDAINESFSIHSIHLLTLN